MNRHTRRAQEKAARHKRKDPSDEIVAVHEAGHAIAKVLSIGEFGYDLKEAISHIEIGLVKMPTPSVDRQVILHSQGVTYGRVFSREIDTAAHEFKRKYLAENPLPQGLEHSAFLSKIVELGRSAGADVGAWFRARTFDAVSGSVAEAIFSKMTFQEIWDGYQAEGDRTSVVQDAKISRIGLDERTATIDKMAVLSAIMMENPTVWSAVLALAKKLPAVGKMDGLDALAVITSVLPGADINEMFAKGINLLDELEKTIGSADVAVAVGADGSNNVLKGSEIVKARVDAKEDFDEVTTIDCTFPVFAETLWRAFGDGASRQELGTPGS